MVDLENTTELSLAELKTKSPSDLLKLAEKLDIENAIENGEGIYPYLK